MLSPKSTTVILCLVVIHLMASATTILFWEKSNISDIPAPSWSSYGDICPAPLWSSYYNRDLNPAPFWSLYSYPNSSSALILSLYHHGDLNSAPVTLPQNYSSDQHDSENGFAMHSSGLLHLLGDMLQKYMFQYRYKWVWK